VLKFKEVITLKKFVTILFLLFVMIVEIRVMLIADSYLKDSNIKNDYLLFGIGMLTGSITAALVIYCYLKIKKKISNRAK